MGLFSTKTNFKEEMREYLEQLMLDYVESDPSSGDVVVQIFSNAESLIRNQSEKDLAKMIKENNLNSEAGALNILQNFAMSEIKPKDIKDIILHSGDDDAYKLYNLINDIKYEKGYISKQQYDENALLAMKLSMGSPF